MLVFLILCVTASSLAIPPSPTATINEYTTPPLLPQQQEESDTIPIGDVSATNHLLSSTRSKPATVISSSVFAFPSDWYNSEHDDSFHAARIAVEERKQQQHHQPAPNNNEDTNNEMSTSSTTTKFPEVENDAAPEDPSSSTNTKVVGVIVGASVGGMVVVGAVALFVWQLHHNRAGDGILVNDPSFSPNTKSPDDDEETKIDITTMIQQQQQQQPPLSPVSEATSSSSSSPSASFDEKASLAQEDDDFGQSTLDAFNQIGTKYRDSDVPCPDLISSVQSSAPARAVPEDEISPSLENIPKKKMPPIKRACPVIIENNNASSSALTFTHTRHGSSTSSSTSPTSLSYPLKKLLHYPRCHMPQPLPPVASPAPTTDTNGSEQQYHLDRLFTLTPEQQQRTRMNQTGMVTPFDLPPTEFLPLQNCPFPLVSRQSVMIDPSKRQGIHNVPNDEEDQQ